MYLLIADPDAVDYKKDLEAKFPGNHPESGKKHRGTLACNAARQKERRDSWHGDYRERSLKLKCLNA
jgi:hypothetical protein